MLLSLWISSVLLAVAAVICCHFALARIKKSPKQLAGKRLAVSGLILGYLMLGLAVFVAYGVHEFNKFFPEFESAGRIQYELHHYCQDYARRHDGRFPTMEELIRDEEAKKEDLGRFKITLQSPLAAQESGIGYVIVPNLTTASPPNTILLYDKNISKRGRRVVCYVNGEARRLTEANFQAALKEQSRNNR